MSALQSISIAISHLHWADDWSKNLTHDFTINLIPNFNFQKTLSMLLNRTQIKVELNGINHHSFGSLERIFYLFHPEKYSILRKNFNWINQYGKLTVLNTHKHTRIELIFIDSKAINWSPKQNDSHKKAEKA